MTRNSPIDRGRLLFGIVLLAMLLRTTESSCGTIVCDTVFHDVLPLVTAPGGRYYVVVMDRGILYPPSMRSDAKERYAYVFVARAPGATVPAMESGLALLVASDLEPDPGDRVLARGTIDVARSLAVSARGDGFVFVDDPRGSERPPNIVWIGPDGSVVRAVSIDSFHPKCKATGPRRPRLLELWIDERSGEVVLASTRGKVRLLDVRDGRVRRGGDADLERALDHPDPYIVWAVLSLSLDGTRPAPDACLARIVEDSSRRLVLRLRAALALARRGRPDVGSALFARVASTPMPPEVEHGDHVAALHDLSEVLGARAVPILRDALRAATARNDESARRDETSRAEGIARAARASFAKLGKEALPTLLTMLDEPGATAVYRRHTAELLGALGDEAQTALPALLTAAGDPDPELAQASIKAAITIGEDTVAEDLASLLYDGTAMDTAITYYFTSVRCPAAVPALIRALERIDPHGVQRLEGRIRRQATRALEFQTGQSLGDDPETWRAWLRDAPGSEVGKEARPDSEPEARSENEDESGS